MVVPERQALNGTESGVFHHCTPGPACTGAIHAIAPVRFVISNHFDFQSAFDRYSGTRVLLFDCSTFMFFFFNGQINSLGLVLGDYSSFYGQD
jgi:hypothetical protein